MKSKAAKILRQQETHVRVVVNNQQSLSRVLARYLWWLSQVLLVLGNGWGISRRSIA
jgi:hypothetical protein